MIGKSLCAIVFLSLSTFIHQAKGCKKSSVPQTAADCKISGAYSGISESDAGNGVFTYFFKENNFTLGSKEPDGPIVTYGGYRASCDSVIISSRYMVNGHFYLLQGKLSNDKNTISGKYVDLDNPEENGIFKIKKLD